MTDKKADRKLEEYLNYYYSGETAGTYLRAIDKFKLIYPNYKKMELVDIEGYLLALKNHGDSVGYRRINLAAIKAFYRFLVDAELVKQHPCPRLFIKEKPPTGKNFDALLGMEELEQLFDLREERYEMLKTRNKVIIGLMIYQGLSSQELVNLRVSDIDTDKGIVRIRKSRKLNGRKLELKPRQVGVLIEYINNERVKLNSTDFDVLILSKLGMAMSVNGLCSFFNSMQGAFHKSLTPKSIRNSVISYWLNDRKIPLEEVQIMAGHRYPSSTEKYINPDSMGQKEVLNRLHNEIFVMK